MVVTEKVTFNAPARIEATAPIILPRPVAEQVAQALHASGDGQVELRLSPEELGSVRLRLVSGQGEVVVLVQAERPETLDLFRRNIELLAQEFRNIGYGSVSFQFGQQQQQQPALRDQAAPNAAPAVPVIALPDAPRLPTAGLGESGLDLRL